MTHVLFVWLLCGIAAATLAVCRYCDEPELKARVAATPFGRIALPFAILGIVCGGPIALYRILARRLRPAA